MKHVDSLIFENLGAAIAVLRRTDSYTTSTEIRKLVTEARQKLSVAQSMLKTTEPCAACAKVERHPGEGYQCLNHPRLNGLTMDQLEAQLKNAEERKDWMSWDSIIADIQAHRRRWPKP